MSADVHRGDCVEVMRGMPAQSVDLIVTDPPYFKVKGEAWDRQWDTPEKFLAWLGTVADEWCRVLRPNGSLYVFASPRMAARVEVMIAERFEVLNSIVWDKSAEPTSALKYGDDRFRQYVQKSERVVFAEHKGADNMAKGEPTFAAKCDELRGFVFEPLRAYLAGERDRAGFTNGQVNEAFQRRTGNPSSGMAGHWFGRSQWALPTAANYAWLRELFNPGGGDRLGRDYDHLRREHDDLRREYEVLRAEFESLRRPFETNADVPYTDVWTFRTVRGGSGRHVCEKPLDMMEHIVRVSSRPGAMVLDSFAGSGVVGEAAVRLGRSFVGIEMDAGWAARAQARVDAAARGVAETVAGVTIAA